MYSKMKFILIVFIFIAIKSLIERGLFMSIQIKNDCGMIEVSNEALANVIGNATTECYGVVGMASKNLVKDGIAIVLGKENYSKGVTLQATPENEFIVDLYVIVGMGIKISEVCSEIQKKVNYILEQTFEQQPKQINVFVQGIKGLDR